MTTNEILSLSFRSQKQLAHLVHHEWITDFNDNICFRPMHFDDGGLRLPLPEPDHCDYVPKEQAAELLACEIQRAVIFGYAGTNVNAPWS